MVEEKKAAPHIWVPRLEVQYLHGSRLMQTIPPKEGPAQNVRPPRMKIKRSLIHKQGKTRKTQKRFYCISIEARVLMLLIMEGRAA